MKENYDNIVYWGYKHYGRRDIRSVFRYNRKDVTMMTFNNQKAVKWEYVDDTQYFKCFHKYDDKIICQIESFDFTTDELLEIYQDKGLKMNFRDKHDNDYMGGGDFKVLDNASRQQIRDHNKSKMRNYSIKNKISGKLANIYEENGRSWHSHFFLDLSSCDLFIPTCYSTLFDYAPFVSHFKSCNNIFAYKSNIVEYNLNRLHLFDIDITNKIYDINIKNVVEAYELNREIVFSYLDHYIIHSRKLESTLIDKKIDYEYFDLDTDSYEKYVDKLLPTVNGYGWGCHPFDRETDRYKKVLHIAEDYVSSRKLTDMRLSGRIIDRIM